LKLELTKITSQNLVAGITAKAIVPVTCKKVSVISGLWSSALDW
jgi:hypothetical protein